MAEPALASSEAESLDDEGSMFLGAYSVHIHGSTFNAYGSDRMEKKKKKIAEAMEFLRLRIEEGAPYDAAAREEVPKCHEQTRVAIINGVDKWAHAQESTRYPLMWMYGPAGSGKTTIMQTVAEKFDKEGSLAASFFFSRLSAGRPRDKENFVITLAHQLSLCIPALQEHLADALSNKSILTKSLEKQLDVLVIGPLNGLDPAQIGPRRVYLVDGLDECNGDAAQKNILDLLNHFIQQVHHRFRVLVASRSLSHIQAFFSQQAIGKIMQSTPLDNDYQADEDVKTFLTSAFNKIREEHPSRDFLPAEWPSCSDIGALVERASGQFIYASVVVGFISDHGYHPYESLQTILGLKVGGNAKPYEQLDAVYAQVLSTVEPQNVEFVQTLFGCLLLDKKEFYVAFMAQETPDALTRIDSFFMMEPGTTQARINRVSPLIKQGDERSQGLQFAHASFPDYLLDRSRSREHFLDLQMVHRKLARQWLNLFPSHSKLHQRRQMHCITIKLTRSLRFYRRYEQVGELVDVARHCMEAEWTSDLRRKILAFDIESALVAEETNENQDWHLDWDGVLFWVCFIFWMKQNALLSSSETDHILDCIHNMIQSVLSELSIPTTLVRIVAAVLTLRKSIHISGAWFAHNHPFGCSSEWENTNIFNDHPSDIFEDSTLNASFVWLCEALGGPRATDGLLLQNSTLYTDFALQYVQSPGTSRVYGSSCEEDNTYHWVINIPIILTKVLPSDRLAMLLTRRYLQVQRESFEQFPPNIMEDFFRAICIYLFECRVPFISEHHHPEKYDQREWCCGICILFDPFKSVCANIEISRDPPALNLRKIANGEVLELREVNLPHRDVIHGIQLLWLQAWIIWFADAVVKFFPVVA